MAYTTINKSSDYFNTTLYTSNNGSSPRTITGVGHNPDMIWIKNRDSASYNHVLSDNVRGIGKIIQPDTTVAESSNSGAGTITATNSDGFVLTAGSSNLSNYDVGTNKQVIWSWKANGAGSSNTDGTITSTVSANTTSGFSIVKWTGTASAGTIGHGLGVAPKVVLVKRYSTSGGGWLMQHGDLTGATYVVKLSATSVEENDGANFNSAFPTSSVFSVYNSNNTNKSGDLHIAYCFAEKQGYSKFGSYTGNGNANGPFLYCGFKPAMIFLKNINDGAKNWEIIDNKRPSSGQNPADDILFPDTSDAESASQTDRLVDFVSNGIKIRGNSGQLNGNGNKFIYLAFAEASLVGSNNVPANAR